MVYSALVHESWDRRAVEQILSSVYSEQWRGTADTDGFDYAIANFDDDTGLADALATPSYAARWRELDARMAVVSLLMTPVAPSVTADGDADGPHGSATEAADSVAAMLRLPHGVADVLDRLHELHATVARRAACTELLLRSEVQHAAALVSEVEAAITI